MLGALVPVSTVYEWKKDMVRSLDGPSNVKGTGGDPHFLEKCEECEKQTGRHTPRWHFDLLITPKFFDILHGSSLMKLPIAVEMNICSELWPREKELLLALLFNCESAIAIDW